MRSTIRVLMEKIDNISKVIDELETTNLPPTACTLDQAVEYLAEYAEMLKDTKVDI